MSATPKVSFDPREFRTALGCFATGVTVVTTRTPAGEPIGLTVNSFNSVSLQPPLVLWSLARNSHSLSIFNDASHWAVHVLAADQEPVSRRFASKGTDKFAGLEFDRGLEQTPLLRGCSARFQCRTAFQYDGGDHVIFVGEVLDFDRSPSAPLVFHDGGYALAMPKVAPTDADNGQLTGSFSKDFLGYLLGRGHYLFRRQLKDSAREAGMGNDEYFLLSTLAMRDRQSVRDLASTIGGLLSSDVSSVLSALVAQGHVRCSGDDQNAVCELAPSGRKHALHKIAAAKSFEAQIIERFGSEDTFVLKTLLTRFLSVMLSGAK